MIQDPRIGRRGPKGRIVQQPKEYVTGESYNPAANPAPTIFWIDKNGEYFVILPVSMPRISSESHASLLKLVEREDEIDFPYNDKEEEDSRKRSKPLTAEQLKAAMEAHYKKKKVEEDDDEYEDDDDEEEEVIIQKPQVKKVVKVGQPKQITNRDIDEDDLPPAPVVPKTAKSLGLVSGSSMPRPKPLKERMEGVPKSPVAPTSNPATTAVAAKPNKKEVTGQAPKKSNE